MIEAVHRGSVPLDDSRPERRAVRPRARKAPPAEEGEGDGDAFVPAMEGGEDD
ncbi:MAG: hypothetical protein IT158_00295 [Bryobacterales bacterium]|nr:hypothetical protein [Bryobacterales bacterium]